ncbi:MAG: 30S ribosome-binding factor RbfA [Rhodospirillaceae bacterium]|nr:30S ribosome-binding factor RbfA [Rhodospirillaceae bacterium]
MTRRSQSAPSQRQLRVGEEIRHALARIFSRGELHDPDLSAADITVSEVRVSADLRAATAFVLPLGGAGTDRLLAALARAVPAVRARLAREVELRFVPTLRFEPDRSFENASRIHALLHDPVVARDIAAGREGAEEPADRGSDEDGA